MKRCHLARVLAVVSLAIGLPASAQMTQVIDLQPGWNAIYVEVVPDDPDIATIFANVPIESVWRFLSTDGVTGLPSDPGAGLRGLEGWRAYFPPDDAVPKPPSDLFTIRPNNAYLVKLGGTETKSLTLTGQPRLAQRRWSPDAFTLTGFNVDPAATPVSFATWFATSTAHAGSPIYRLDADGFWRLVVDQETETISAGTAYWVFTTGPSKYQGPLEVQIDDDFPDLDFSVFVSDAGITLVNRSANPQDVYLTRFPADAPLPLVARGIDVQADLAGNGGPAWVPLLEKFSPASLGAGASERFEIAPRRSDMVSERLEEVLAFTSSDGIRVLVPAAVERALPAVTRSAGANVLSPGLWLGTAEINEVNLVQSTSDAGALRPTAQDMRLRLILHVDANLQPRLLSQVVQLFEPGLTDDNGTCASGRPVLITERERFGDYEGLTLRGDDFVGSRLSTVSYDFGERPDAANILRRVYQAELELTAPNHYAVTITHGPYSASNPFYHPFHPDHDNLDENGLRLAEPNGQPVLDPVSGAPLPQEVPTITRQLVLQFCPDSALVDACTPGGQADPGTVLRGTLLDTVSTGLHHEAVTARGAFEFERIVEDPSINPAPLSCP